MINRENYLITKAYLAYSGEVLQNEDSSVKRKRLFLRYLMEWADDTHFAQAPNVRPTFQRYIAAKDLAPYTQKKTLAFARLFFKWLKLDDPARYKAITPAWIEALRPARANGKLKKRELVVVEDVRAIMALPVGTLREERDRVAAAFLFLSGMRATAFCTLPIAAVDLAARTVAQLPELGVRTKNGKAAITHLLDIPDLLQVVKDWDTKVREVLPPTALWYSHITRDGELHDTPIAGIGRGAILAHGLQHLCELAQIEYHSPHKYRHGHVVYALKQAKNLAELKAISQNVMHSSMVITDSIYGTLPSEDVGTAIASLGKGVDTLDDATLNRLAELLLKRMDK